MPQIDLVEQLEAEKDFIYWRTRRGRLRRKAYWYGRYKRRWKKAGLIIGLILGTGAGVLIAYVMGL